MDMDGQSPFAFLPYRSVIIRGRAHIVAGRQERVSALRALMQKYQPEGGYGGFPEEKLALTAVVRIDIVEMTGKQDLGNENERDAVLRILSDNPDRRSFWNGPENRTATGFSYRTKSEKRVRPAGATSSRRRGANGAPSSLPCGSRVHPLTVRTFLFTGMPCFSPRPWDPSRRSAPGCTPRAGRRRSFRRRFSLSLPPG